MYCERKSFADLARLVGVIGDHAGRDLRVEKGDTMKPVVSSGSDEK